jgi:hypothetical protein
MTQRFAKTSFLMPTNRFRRERCRQYQKGLRGIISVVLYATARRAAHEAANERTVFALSCRLAPTEVRGEEYSPCSQTWGICSEFNAVRTRSVRPPRGPKLRSLQVSTIIC